MSALRPTIVTVEDAEYTVFRVPPRETVELSQNTKPGQIFLVPYNHAGDTKLYVTTEPPNYPDELTLMYHDGFCWVAGDFASEHIEEAAAQFVHKHYARKHNGRTQEKPAGNVGSGAHGAEN